MESNAINWCKILIYGSVLFFAQFAIGFAEGWFSPGVNDTNHIKIVLLFVLSTLTSLFVCTSIFAHMAIYQASRPYLHACLSLFLCGAAFFGLSAVLEPLLGSAPTLLIYFGWLTDITGLFAGVLIGRAISRKHAGNQEGVA